MQLKIKLDVCYAIRNLKLDQLNELNQLVTYIYMKSTNVICLHTFVYVILVYICVCESCVHLCM